MPDAPPTRDVDGALVVDVGRSIDYRAGPVPGAVWGIRTRLDRLAGPSGQAGRVVLASPDGTLAHLAVAEVQAMTAAPVQVLDGGTAGWAADRPLDASPGDPPDAACVDWYLRPYDRTEGIEAAMQAYLSWEIDLVHEIARDGTVAFGA